MKVLKIMGIVLLVLIGVVLILGIIAPQKYEVVRSETINAPRSLVSSHVMYWKSWEAWLPWAEMDSTIEITVEGVDGTQGSVFKWTGKEAGVGEMMTTDVMPRERIDYHLKFIKPWASESDGYVEMNDEGDGTKVSWSFYGKTPLPLNAMNLFMNMDRMIGKDFEKGLVLLKNICEKQSGLIRSYQVREIQFPPKSYAAVKKEVAMTRIQLLFCPVHGNTHAGDTEERTEDDRRALRHLFHLG